MDDGHWTAVGLPYKRDGNKHMTCPSCEGASPDSASASLPSLVGPPQRLLITSTSTNAILLHLSSLYVFPDEEGEDMLVWLMMAWTGEGAAAAAR